MRRPRGTLFPWTAPVTIKTSIKQAPPLQGSMTCEPAFRTAATHYLHQLTAQHEGTAAGEAAALHAMRVAMTRLRTTIALFSPMVEGDEQVAARRGAEVAERPPRHRARS